VFVNECKHLNVASIWGNVVVVVNECKHLNIGSIWERYCSVNKMKH